MIVIEQEKCIGCGLCAGICHEGCITLSGRNGKKVEKIDPVLCSTCTQCVAICPQGALSWNQAAPVPYDCSALPSSRQLTELLGQRRTIRHFQDKKIDQALVEEIIGLGVYAPTNNYNLRAIVVDDPSLHQAFDGIVLRLVRRVYNLCYRSALAFNLIRRLVPEINAKNRAKLGRGLASGRTYDSWHTSVIFIVGDRRILQSEASAQYALYNMILYAQTKGLGSRINAALTVSLDRSRRARGLLGLQKHEHILGALELGYPAIKFRNRVSGKSLPVQWGGRETAC